jgi:hypothetical protein
MKPTLSPTLKARQRGRNRRWLRLAALVVIGYGAVTYGWPWVRQRFDERRLSSVDSDTGNVPALVCVERAERAVADFRDKTETLGGSQVQLNWREAMRLVQTEIDGARRACRCDAEACIEAADAMEALSATNETFGATVVQGGTPRDVEGAIVRVEKQLASARSQLER